jgi:hypothetical protein
VETEKMMGELKKYYGAVDPKEADREIDELVGMLQGSKDVCDVLRVVDDFLGQEGKMRHLITLKLLHLAATQRRAIMESTRGLYI